MNPQEKSDPKAGMLVVFLTALTAIIVVLMCQMLLGLRSDVQELKTALSALEKETTAMVPTRVPLEIIQEKCTSCHTERRFAGVHGTQNEWAKIVQHMSDMPDARVTAQDLDKIHGALTFLKCTHCHSADALKKLAILNNHERAQIVFKMRHTPGANITRDEAEEILKAYDKIIGF